MADDPSTPLDESSSEEVSPLGGPDDLDRLAELDDVLGGHTPADGDGNVGGMADDASDAASGEVPPEGLDAILLLRQWAAESRGDDPTAVEEMPRRIGRFAIVRKVGEGGFARVYEAFDTRLRRRVALKVARPEVALPAGARRRFVLEAELAARLDHPHVVTIHEAGEADGHVYIAEEFGAGGNLGQWLERHPGPMPPRTAARIVMALAGAVAHTHGFCILHRDIKPTNILLVPGESGPLAADSPASDRQPRLDVKLADFGLGKLAEVGADSAGASDLTRADTRLGTPAWMAPEQVDRALGPVGPATDIHALGILLDRLLTGRCAHAGGDDAESMRLVVAAEPVAPDRIVRGVPADLAAVTLKCLAKRPAERYASAAELAGDLARFLDGRPTVARPVSLVERGLRVARRHRPVVAASLLALLASAAALAALAVRWHERELLAARAAEVRGHQAAATLRRGFEAWRAGDVAGALSQIESCRDLDRELADSLAGRWLRARLHGEEAILLGQDGESGEEGAIDLHAIAVSPDGGRVAVGGAVGRLSLLSLDAGGEATPVRTVSVHDEINDVAFAPDGRLVATVGQDGRLCVCDATDGTIRRSWSVGAGALFGVAWSPDGRTLACGGVGRSVSLFAVDGGDSPLAVLQPFESLVPPVPADAEIEAILFTGPGMVAVAAGNRILLHDVAADRVVRDLSGSDGTVAHLALSPDGERLVSAGSDRVPRVWDVEQGTLVAALPIHPSWVAGCRFTPDGQAVVTGCRDGVVRVCPIGSPGETTLLVGHRGRVWDVDVLPDGRVLSAGNDGTLRRWAAGASQEKAGVVEHPVAVGTVTSAVGLAAPGARGDVVVASRDPPGIARFDAAGRPVAEIAAAFSGEWRIAIDEPRGRLAASGAEYRIATAALPDRGAVGTARVLPAEIAGSGIVWSGDAGLLVGGADGRLWLWDDTSGRGLVLDDLGRGIDAIDVTVAGDTRAVVVAGKLVRVLDLSPSGTPRKGSARTLLELPGSTGSVRAVAWAPDGRSFVIGTNVGGVERYDAATGLSLGSFARHSREIRTLEWSADGRTLLSADAECVRFSDVRTTTVFDDFRPGWTIESARLTSRADGSTGLVVAGNAGPSGLPGGRIALAELPAP